MERVAEASRARASAWRELRARLGAWWAARRERATATEWSREWKPLALIAVVFVAIWHLPVGQVRFDAAVVEALELTKWYAREHVLLCLIPAFFIAGAISTFVNRGAVLRYLGPSAHKPVAYGVASVAGMILAVCSCTVLPLFAGIYAAGAGLGPAATFLYAGPAISVLAVILTGKVLGLELAAARALGAVAFALVIGVLMHVLFRRGERKRALAAAALPVAEQGRPLGQSAIFFGLLVGILVFANWGEPGSGSGLWYGIYASKWTITAALGVGLGAALVRWFGLRPAELAAVALPTALLALAVPGRPAVPFLTATIGLSVVISMREGELGEWFAASWGFAKQILPLLLIGILAAGLLLGRPGHEGLLPGDWVARSVGGNSPTANLFASVAGAFMYFATLTEVPILEGLLGNGMGKGPALALLLAGPALSLPSILVIRSVLGGRKTAAFVLLVIVMATAAGLLYGALRV